MTGKYKGWSKVQPGFRRLAIYHKLLPIIVINNSAAYKAQSFTLFHELEHLLKKKSALDEQKEIKEDEEIWCNRFAGAVLMPQDDFLEVVKSFVPEEPLDKQIIQINKLAKIFKVSPYAFLLRMRYLNIISLSQSKEIESQLRINYSRQKQQENKIFIARNLAKEALEQYGSIYSRAVVQTYQNQDIGLHKFCKLLGIKKASDALKLESLL